MDWYFSAPLWLHQGDAPNTKKSAFPCDPVQVRNKTVIHVKSAYYRSATFDGTFLLEEQVALALPQSGTERVEIFCRWFGRRLRKCEPHFKIDMSTAKVERNYTGPVFTDFTKPNTR